MLHLSFGRVAAFGTTRMWLPLFLRFFLLTPSPSSL